MSKNYVFGPVPSRRLGLSLGVDIVPMKSCTLDCVYCQLGRSSDLTADRKKYVDIDEVASQIKAKLETGPRPDHITISGSGEPTLHTELGRLVDKIKEFTSIPVAIMTNGTLLFDAQVRKNCLNADVVLPSLDGCDAQTFAKINRPHKSLHFDTIVEGLIQFRKEYKGQIWLEIFIIDGINTDPSQLKEFGKLIDRIKPDKVQLNTAVRPTTEKGITAATPQILAIAAALIAHDAEIIADFAQKTDTKAHTSPEAVLEMLQRRPCSVEDVAAGLNISAENAVAYISQLLQADIIKAQTMGTRTYYLPK